MKKFSQFTLSIVLVSTITSAYAKDLETLENWAAKTKNWSSDTSEIIYVLGRCSAAFMTMAEYGSISSDLEGKKNANVLMSMGKRFAALSIDAGKSIGVSEKFLTLRIDSLLKIYESDMLKNITIKNTAFGEDFKSDISFCSEFYKTVFK